MASVVQTAKQVSAAATTVKLTLAAAPQYGNLLIAAIAYLGGDGVTTPDGTWTLIDSGTYNTDSLAVYRKTVGTDSNTYTFTITGTSDHCSGMLIEIQGVDATTPINQHGISAGSTATTHATPSKTPTVLGCLSLAFLTMDDATSTLVAAGGGVSAGWNVPVNAYGLSTTFHPSTSAQKVDLTTDLVTGISMTFTTNTSTASGGVNDGLAAIVLIAPSMTTKAYARIPWQQRAG